jgi:hypothetical protein
VDDLLFLTSEDFIFTRRKPQMHGKQKKPTIASSWNKGSRDKEAARWSGVHVEPADPQSPHPIGPDIFGCRPGRILLLSRTPASEMVAAAGVSYVAATSRLLRHRSRLQPAGDVPERQHLGSCRSADSPSGSPTTALTGS